MDNDDHNDDHNARIAVLETHVQELLNIVNVLWQTRQPQGSFRVNFDKDRFRNAEELEIYLKGITSTVTSVIAAQSDGQLEGSSVN